LPFASHLRTFSTSRLQPRPGRARQARQYDVSTVDDLVQHAGVVPPQLLLHLAFPGGRLLRRSGWDVVAEAASHVSDESVGSDATRLGAAGHAAETCATGR